ncbi:CidA/LrgA family holin-like protein [Lentibacillus halophilus]|uniref:CidA/LrgA family holin-like protein n=1 Tax=Lentibacillus halophilus TaxID=295065 RepID=A0ABN0Z385_9BACI
MKMVNGIMQIAFLYVFYLAGSWLQDLLNWPIPGSIVGLLLLFTALVLKICPVNWVETGSNVLLTYMPLLFVPATVGVMNHFGLFVGHTVWLFIITIISTLLVMITAGHTSRLLEKRSKKGKEKAECKKHLSESSS